MIIIEKLPGKSHPGKTKGQSISTTQIVYPTKSDLNLVAMPQRYTKFSMTTRKDSSVWEITFVNNRTIPVILSDFRTDFFQLPKTHFHRSITFLHRFKTSPKILIILPEPFSSKIRFLIIERDKRKRDEKYIQNYWLGVIIGAVLLFGTEWWLEGKIKRMADEVVFLDFRIASNTWQSQINMLFLYEDLKVRLLKEKDGEVKVRSFLTTLANGILLIKNNPGSKGERKAEATAERDVYRSQFNYLWRSLLAGLKKTIGL